MGFGTSGLRRLEFRDVRTWKGLGRGFGAL